MFGRKKDLADKERGKGDIEAFLGAGSSFDGKLMFEDTVRLDGNFKGEIVSTGTLIIGAAAQVKADLRVDTLILSGSFQGNIEAVTGVVLKKPAHVVGNITTPTLAVEAGVVMNGTLEMEEQPEVPAEAQREAAEGD
jgi:cytoskeletal protein CcmA (bactofilin family)